MLSDHTFCGVSYGSRRDCRLQSILIGVKKQRSYVIIYNPFSALNHWLEQLFFPQTNIEKIQTNIKRLTLSTTQSTLENWKIFSMLLNRIHICHHQHQQPIVTPRHLVFSKKCCNFNRDIYFSDALLYNTGKDKKSMGISPERD